MFLATGLYRVERGSGTDEYGDATDVATQTWDHVQLALTEVTRRASSGVVSYPGDTFVRERVLAGRARPGFVIADGDILVDERTGERLAVTETARPGGLPMMSADGRFTAARVQADTDRVTPTAGAW